MNFRSTHANEAIKLLPTILENFEYTDILRGSTEDFYNMFGEEDAAKVYRQRVGFYCRRFLCTDAGKDVRLFAGDFRKSYPVPPIETVSTIGAGDNFNAGVVYGLLRNRIRRTELDSLSESDWDDIVRCGLAFSTDVCRQVGNSVSAELVAALRGC